MKKIHLLAMLLGLVFLFLPNHSFASDYDVLRQQASRTEIPEGCPMKSDEALVCEVVLCNPLGLVISESRSECMKTNRRFAIYLATLGFWDKPPKCKMRDKDCNKTGKAKSASIDVDFCDELENFDERNTCRNTLGYPVLDPNPQPPTYPRPPIDPCRDDFRHNVVDCNRKEF